MIPHSSIQGVNVFNWLKLYSLIYSNYSYQFCVQPPYELSYPLYKPHIYHPSSKYLTPQVLQLNCYFFIFFCILTIGDRPYLVSVAVRCLRDTAFVLSVIFSLYYFLFFSFHFFFFFTDKLEVLYLLMIQF